MTVSKSVQIAFTLLPLMKQRMKMEEVVSLISSCRLPHRKSVEVLRQLSTKGFLQVHRGAGGGFSFLREPQNIFLMEIIEALGDEPSPKAPKAVRKAVGYLLDGKMEGHTLADLQAV